MMMTAPKGVTKATPARRSLVTGTADRSTPPRATTMIPAIIRAIAPSRLGFIQASFLNVQTRLKYSTELPKVNYYEILFISQASLTGYINPPLDRTCRIFILKKDF